MSSEQVSGDEIEIEENFENEENEENENFGSDSSMKSTENSLSPLVEKLRHLKNKLPINKPVRLESSTRLKVTVNKLHATAEWKWIEGSEDTCGICRMEFEAACTNCKFPGDDCPLVVGICRHAFHMHCIVKWTESSNNSPKPQCPLCRQEWKFSS